MLKNILKLDGVAVLNKTQQRIIKGGSVTCDAIDVARVLDLHDGCWQGADDNSYQWCMDCGYAVSCGGACT
ncbi:hypothetical protein [uncultured Aquimarina sp.]|uniref:hypothetical protein n=1 Tax=uncultured Aquimarina sp. TaxID=575652 RepID=UPI0026054578|nr:hypothetical protein [uncultured Aquimarina sp.]